VRFVYPLLAIAAYLLFVASLAVGLAAVLLVPVAAGLIAAGLVAAGQFAALIRLLESLLRLTFGALGRAGTLLADLFRAFSDGDPEPTRVAGSYGREALPELFRLVDEVAAEVGTRGVDRILLLHDGNAAVTDLRTPGLLPRPRRRLLLVGLPYVYALSLDELRAVLAHELAHLTLGHVALHRATRRMAMRMERQIQRMEEGSWFAIDPVYWSVRLSLGLLAGIYCPWSRLQEYEADRRSALAAGGNNAVAALRKAREDVPAIQHSVVFLFAWCRANRAAPRHLGEAATRLADALPARQRKELALRSEGDPFELEGRSHPSTAHRIAALRGLPERPSRHPLQAARYLPDLRNLEEHLTRAALRAPDVWPTRSLVERIMTEGGASGAEREALPS